jgi:membrane protease YdiL (CAAX protease family)
VSSFQVFSFIIVALLSVLLASGHAKRVSEKKEKAINQSIVHVLLRTGFIISYEWFFRGCLLFVCVNAFGIFPAVAINILLYSLIHSFSSKKEFAGSILFGGVLCAFTIWCDTIWPAIVLHWLLSFSYDSIILHSQFVRTPKYRL